MPSNQGLTSSNDQVRLAAWRKKGAFDKCHNIVLHARSSQKRRKYFESKQRELGDRRIYQPVMNGGIKWNSDLDMIERVLCLKDAIQLYQDHHTNDTSEALDARDCLNANAWREPSELQDLPRH